MLGERDHLDGGERMIIRIDVLPSDVIALGMGLVLFNTGVLIWFGYKVDFLARALRLEGEEGERVALIIGRWLTFLGLATFLVPFIARVFGPAVFWPYLIVVAVGGVRVLVTALRHYRHPREKV